MLGYVADLAFYYVPDKAGITGLNWRLMLGSAGFPALIVMAQMPFLPESPRWLMSKKRNHEAYQSMLRLRGHDLLAARDLFYIHVLLEEEEAIVRGRNRFVEIFTIGRNRRAMLGSTIGRSAVCRRGRPITDPTDSHVWPAILRRQRNRLLYCHHFHLCRVLQH